MYMFSIRQTDKINRASDRVRGVGPHSLVNPAQFLKIRTIPQNDEKIVENSGLLIACEKNLEIMRQERSIMRQIMRFHFS